MTLLHFKLDNCGYVMLNFGQLGRYHGMATGFTSRLCKYLPFLLFTYDGMIRW